MHCSGMGQGPAQCPAICCAVTASMLPDHILVISVLAKTIRGSPFKGLHSTIINMPTALAKPEQEMSKHTAAEPVHGRLAMFYPRAPTMSR